MRTFSFRWLFLSYIILSIFLFIVIIQARIHLMPTKVTGSFEYVRKGESLIDKGKYKEAIKYFEKACESSPENEVIKSDLVYAYTAYGKSLESDGKYDEAIDYLEKAYILTPDTSTMQNLTMMYSEKALREAQKGYLPRAEDAYTKMRDLAYTSDIVTRNLSIVLYNDAINEYKSGREDIAILCLKQSASMVKESRTYEVLGDIYYKHAKYRMARFCWQKAKSLNPSNASIYLKLEKISKEMSLTPDEKEIDLPHFEVRYRRNLPIDEKVASETLENAWKDVGEDLGYRPKAKTKIFFYTREDFKKIFNMPRVVNAFYDGSIKIPAADKDMDNEEFARHIYHEYTHAMVSAITNNNCPPWLSEGIAVWEECRNQPYALEKLLIKIKDAPDISIQFLEKCFVTTEITEDKSSAYIMAFTFVSYIVDKWGIKGLQGLLKRLADKQHIANAIDDEFLLSEKAFETRWRNFIINRYSKYYIK